LRLIGKSWRDDPGADLSHGGAPNCD
jgi:hypothetical protein